VAQALGDRNLPDAGSWPDLRRYLVRTGAAPEMIAAAQTVWRSYVSHSSRVRRDDATTPLGRLKVIALQSGSTRSAGIEKPC